MGENDPRATAKIYDLAAFRRAQPPRPKPVTARPVPTPSGGAWYHEAAIRDDDRPQSR